MTDRNGERERRQRIAKAKMTNEPIAARGVEQYRNARGEIRYRRRL